MATATEPPDAAPVSRLADIGAVAPRALTAPMLGVDTDVLAMAGQTVVVTGAGTGIGRATSLVAGARGANVVLAGRHAEALEETAAQLGELGASSLVVPTDVRDPDACKALIDAAMDAFGRIDGLVNNAGGSRSRTDAGWSLDDWDRMVDLNLRSVWLLSRAAADAIRGSGGGSIVNVASAAALSPRPEHAPYGVAKAGVIHLTSILSTEYASAGVRVNCVAPGLVKTEGFIRAMTRLGRDPDDQWGRAAFGRPGDPFEIAYPVLFFLSDASSYVSGETLYAGGGPRFWSAR